MTDSKSSNPLADEARRIHDWILENHVPLSASRLLAIADEIERLQQERDDAVARDRARDPCSGEYTEFDTLLAERDRWKARADELYYGEAGAEVRRLRAALDDALAYTEHGPEDSMPMLRKQLNQVARVCREALSADDDMSVKAIRRRCEAAEAGGAKLRAALAGASVETNAEPSTLKCAKCGNTWLSIPRIGIISACGLDTSKSMAQCEHSPVGGRAAEKA